MTVAFTNLCACGCGKPANRRFAIGHYLRAPREFDATRHRIEDRGYSSPCWIWQGATRANGYGSVQYQGFPERAHRAYYQHFIGPIPTGMTIDHLCFVSNCVNPAHLEPVSAQENTSRAFRAGRGHAANNARKTVCKRGHPFSAENTIIKPNGARGCRACKVAYMAEYFERRRSA